ncbi:MAG: HAD family hydrolase [Candidatus Shapirobacteria bacterium]
MNEIKFVYFDVGGVTIKDFSDSDTEWNAVKKIWGIPSERSDELDKKFDDFEEFACVGSVEINDFLPILEKEFGVKVPKNFSINEEFANRFYKNEGIWKIINECKNKGKIGLLTNMYLGMLETIRKKELVPEIEWNTIVDSSLVKFKKPQKEIYEIAQLKSGVKAEEILFVDNMERNLVIPRSIGWKTFLYNSGDYERSNKELEQFLG